MTFREETTMVAIRKTENEEDPYAIEGIQLLTAEEGYAFFDRKAREELGMPGAEFLRRWDAGEFRPIPDTVEGRRVGQLVMMLPFARQTNS